MIRRNSSRIAVGLCLAAMAGCGGTAPDDLFPAKHQPTTLVGFGTARAERVYFGPTNHLDVSTPTLATFELTAGSRIELELATRDASPLVFEIHRVRRDGTTELLEPVHSDSGFHLSNIEASSPGMFALYFPANDHREVTAIIHLLCTESASRCAPSRQPFESCTQSFPCDEGLVCSGDAKKVTPLPYLGLGTCLSAPESPPIP